MPEDLVGFQGFTLLMMAGMRMPAGVQNRFEKAPSQVISLDKQHGALVLKDYHHMVPRSTFQFYLDSVSFKEF